MCWSPKRQFNMQLICILTAKHTCTKDIRIIVNRSFRPTVLQYTGFQTVVNIFLLQTWAQVRTWTYVIALCMTATNHQQYASNKNFGTQFPGAHQIPKQSACSFVYILETMLLVLDSYGFVVTMNEDTFLQMWNTMNTTIAICRIR